MTGPIPLVEVTRGDAVESYHCGSAVIADATGIRWSIGDSEGLVFPRSATKLIQALPLVETGAADRYAIDPPELALACASHNGEAVHVDLAASWLARLGLSVRDLQCGPHWPMYEPAMRELAIQGSEPSALHNNCSGKHTGFLATALYLGETRDNYIALLHPTQQRWLTALAELADCSLQHMPMGVDGCSIPSPALPLHRLARAYAKFGTPQSCGPVRAAAIARISAAVRQHPHLIAGEGRACTRIVAATGGRVLVKVGAEGVFAGFIPEAGVGFALKIADGASRAAEVAVIGLIRRALGTAHPLHEALEPLARQVILTRRDVPAGVIRPTAAL